MMRKLASILEGISILGTALLGSTLSGSAQSLPNRALSTLDRVYPNESYAQYYYHRHYYHDDSAAVAAGVAGLAAGALIGTAIASQAQAAPPPPPGTVDPSVAAYCARKYRSYDPVTGTFMARNGMRYVCTYP